MTTQQLRIGFIGLGKMGSGMCANLQAAGYALTVYNRTKSKTQPFAEKGAKVADSVKALVEQSDVIFTSLLDDKSVLAMCDGDEGILAAMRPGKIHVGLTTIQPTTADVLKQQHAAQGCHYIAAPVVGRPDAAAAGKLITFLAGDASAIAQVKPLTQAYAVKQIVLGETASAANALKICVNYMAMAQLAMLGEVFTYAEKSGLPKAMVLNVASMFFAGNEPMQEYANKIAEREFDTVGFDLSAGLKDALIFETAFIASGVKPSAIMGAKDNLVAANANGLGSKDWSALTQMTRLMAGLKD